MPQVIAARYELVELLGRGGMGAVWRARDRTLDREVAIKEVSLPQGLDGAQVERVYARTFREARSAARLDHPGIVTVHDVVEEDGRPWIVMRLVPAPALDRVVRAEGPLPPARVAAIGADLLDALRAAHEAGVVHRDVKPGNVLLTRDRAVLTDFGIATVAGDETLTQAGAIVGSPAYLAPEQARRQKASPSSDLWSLGATLYAAVEGHPPYVRPDVWGVMAAVLSDEPDPQRLSGPLRPVLDGLLRKDPAQRMHPDEAGRLLREIAQGPARHVPAWAPPHGDLAPGPANLTAPPAPATTTHGDGDAAGDGRRPAAPARWAVIVPAAVFAAVLVAGVVAVVIFVNGGGDGAGDPPSGRPSAGASGSGPRSGPARGSGSRGSVPAGYRLYNGPAWVAAVPEGWKAEPESRDVTFRDPDGAATRGISVQRVADVTGNEAKWLDDAAAQFKNDKDYPDYKQVRYQENVPFLGGQAAEMEFTFTKNGKPGRVWTRLFSFNGGLYDIVMIAQQGNWEASRPYFTTFLDTFRAP
ncbi:protein kinase [Actinomadura sp. J1-007]|nr:serine/threonine-protein kinase [Actinomadura sp. J1-007]MWK33687.1 protein kinase [Actinomadura sp. J1-007]